MATIEQFKTPKGQLMWAVVDGEGKENLSGRMKYTVTIVVASDDPVVERIKNFWETNKPAKFKKDAKSLGIYPHRKPSDDKDEDGKTIYDEVEGFVELRFSTDTAYPDGKPKKIQIYNAKGNKVALPAGTKIGNGSIGRVAGAMGIYENKKGANVIDAGVTLYLNDLQIVKLVEYSQDAGFEAEDDSDDAWTGEDDSWSGEEEQDAPKTRL